MPQDWSPAGGAANTASPAVDISNTTRDLTLAEYAQFKALVSGAGNNVITQSTTYPVTPSAGMTTTTYEQGGDGAVAVLPSPENLVAYSEDFTNAWWSKSGCTVATTSAVSPPAGVTTVCIFTVSASNSFAERASFFNSLSGLHTARLWVRGVGASIGKRVCWGNYQNNDRLEKRVTLTANWQLIEVPMLLRAITNSALYVDFARAGQPDGLTSNLASGDQVYVAAAHVFVGRDQSYALTGGSTVTRTYELYGPRSTQKRGDRITVREESSGVYSTDLFAPLLQRPNASVAPSRRGRGDTIVLAPCDAQNPYAADYILTGSGDDVPISAAIASLRAVGGSVKILAGTVGLTSFILHDAPWVTLQGEARGFWNNFSARWPTKSTEGKAGGTKLLQLTSATDIIRVGTSYLNGMTRHNGIGFKNLYLYGASGGRGIFDSANTDVSEISGCAFHNLASCIDVAWDVPLISGNSMQSCSGDAVTHRFVYGAIVGNIMYDIGGSGVVVTGAAGGGVQIVGNSIGSVGASAVVVRAPMVVVSGNTIQGVNVGHGVEVYKSETNGPVGVAISGNTISVSMVSGNAVAANTTGHGIYLHDNATDCAITGNTLTNANTAPTGYAVALGNDSGSDATVANCAVVGNVCKGTWNNSGAAKIITRGGANNRISLNAGDSA